MWPLMIVVGVTIVTLALRGGRWESPSLRVSRWAYALFVPLSLLYFPIKSGFRVYAPSCEWRFGPELALHSLTNYPHIVLFAIFYLLTYAQLPRVTNRAFWSFGACLVMGLLVELAQGVTRSGHCRMRDLIPDTAGATAGAVSILLGSWMYNRWRTRQT